MGEIKHLPEAIHNSVRSGTILFDLTRVVEELIFNSLDAGATKISIAVDTGTCYVKVMDNGCGITRDGLGLLAERYATSKFDQLAHEDSIRRTFGFRGEALSSIANVSLLEVLTKAHGRPNGYRKVMKGCKCLYIGIDDGRQDVGTTVIVRDLFYNQPVRRRQIQSSTKKALQSVKKCVLRISLIHPKVSFNVVDIESDEELLCATSSSSPLSRLISGFGVEVANSLHELNATDGLIRLSGYLSSPFPISSSKAFQYIYINSRYICKGAIHKLLNQIGSGFNSLQHQKVNLGSQNAKRCGIQACFTFILNLSCPRSWYDITFEPSKTSVEFKDWKPIIRFIEKAITRFWSEAFSNGDSLTDNTDVPADSMQTEAGHTFSPVEDFFAKCGNSKRKGRVQNQAAAISIPTRNLYMQIEDCGHSDYVIGNKFSCHDVPNPRDSSSKSFDEPLTQSRIVVDAEIGNCDSAADYNIFLTEDQIMGNKFYNEYIDHTSSSSFHDEHHCVGMSMPNNFMKSDFPSDPFKICNVDNVREDSEKPFLGRCTSQKRQVLDAESLIGSKGFDFPIESLRNKRSRHMPMEPSSLSKNLVKSSLSGAYLERESNFLEDSDSVFGTKFHGFERDSDENLLRDHESSARCNLLGDHEIMDCDFVAWSTASREDCSSVSGVDIYSDFKNCALTDEGMFGFHQQNSRFDVPFPRSFDMFSDETKWWSSDLHGIHDDCCRARISHQIPSSMCLDDDKDQKFMKENCGMQRPRRSHSAPPVYCGKKKFLALNNHLPMEAEKSKYRHVDDLGASGLERSKRSSGVSQLDSESNFTKVVVAHTRMVKEGPDAGSVEKVKMKEKSKGLHFNYIQNPVVSEPKWQRGYPKNADGGKTHKLQNEDATLDLSSGLLHLAGDSLVPESINKNLLEDAKVLQQVDKKFIPVVGHGVLAIIDQHAADERIRLEELRQKVLSGGEKTITYLDTEKELVMPEIGYQLLHSYSELIQNWGWLYDSRSQRSRSFKKNLNILHKQPTSTTLIAVPRILGVNLTDVDLLEFLQQLADTDGSSVIPPSVHRVLNSKACRGAIMFGDSLLPSECSLIVEELNQTSLCFQCAHGRPTTVPLVNLEALHKQLEKLESWNGGSDTWRGLRRHVPSLERAKNRLGSSEVHC